jgi:excinuclease ABC subunit B
MDADKEGFLRDNRSLIQTIGRAARNDRGKVIMYADKITGSMREAIDETYRRRQIQQEHNEANNITPKTVLKSKDAIMNQTRVADSNKVMKNYYVEPEEHSVAADPVVAYMTKEQLEKVIQKTQKSMEKAAKELDFMEAARLRDELMDLKKMHQNR